MKLHALVVIMCLASSAAQAREFTAPGWYLVEVNNPERPNPNGGKFPDQKSCMAFLAGKADQHDKHAKALANALMLAQAMGNKYECRHLDNPLPTDQ